jgi:hypothetical protein
MHGLNEIRKLNAVKEARHSMQNTYGGEKTEPPHLPRTLDELGQPPNHQERIESAIDHKLDSPFVRFWAKLNSDRAIRGEPEALYGDARRAFSGGPTPVGSLTLVERGEGLRAVPVERSFANRVTWHGEYREVSAEGVKWHRVKHGDGSDVVYADPTDAITSASLKRTAHIDKAFR